MPELVGAPDDARPNAIAATYPHRIDAVTDDGPFFWHFSGFGDVLSHYFESIKAGDPELLLGERVLILLLGFAVLYAGIFLLAPFFFVRREWKVLPAKPLSALYFAALGLGFIFFEITMIQRLVLYLGYPTYSLTVTLASLLVFTGLGALLSHRLAPSAGTVVAVVFVVLCGAHRVLRVGPRPAHGRDPGPGPPGPGPRRPRSSPRRSACASACSCRSVSAS